MKWSLGKGCKFPPLLKVTWGVRGVERGGGGDSRYG